MGKITEKYENLENFHQKAEHTYMKLMSAVVVVAMVVMMVLLMATNEVIFRTIEGDTDAFRTLKDEQNDDSDGGGSVE